MKSIFSIILFTLLSFSSFSQNNYSLEFDGANNQYVSINPVVGLAGSDYTIEAWFKSSTINSLQTIFDGYEAATLNSGLHIEIQTNGTLRYLHREPPAISGGTNIYSTSIINDGAWHHFAAVKGPDDFMRLYIDGNLEAVSANTVVNSTIPLDINLGRNHNDARYLSGRLDEFRIWNIARTQDEIQSTLNCPPIGNELGLIGYWKFEEGFGTITADQTFSANSAMLENGTFWSTDVPLFQCCSSFEKITDQNCKYVFYGYAPQSCTDLTTVVAGGTEPYSYLWNNGETTSSINVCPTSDQVYIATITDAEGCVLMDTFEVKAVNVICGNNNNKVKVCHNHENSLCISVSAVETHLNNHGDHLGDCGIDPCDDGITTGLNDVFESENFEIHPNPANELITIEIPDFNDQLALHIYNINGQLVKRENVTNNNFLLSIADLEVGTYQISLSNYDGNMVQKLVIIR